jgi:Outer membrane protein
MLKQLVLVAALCMSLLPVARAQETSAGDTLKWDLQSCLDYAKKNNITIQSLRWDEQSSEQDLLLAKAAKYPSLSANLRQTLINSRNADPVVGGFQTQANFSGNYGVNSSWVLYNGGYLNHDVKQKDLLVNVANLSVQQTENDITLQITQAFLNILLAKENIVYLGDLLSTSQAQLQQGKQRYDAGSISKKDYLQLEATLANDQYNLVTARNAVRQNIITLKQILQIPSGIHFDVVAPDTLITDQSIPSLQEATQQAMATRPEVKIGELGIQAAELELEKARAGTRPTVSLGGGLTTGYSDNQAAKYFSQLNNNFYQTIGVIVGIPIFNNRINKTNIERSKIQIEQARLSLQGTKTTLDQAVEQAYISALNAQAQLTAAETQWRTSQESFQITTEQVRLGALNTVDLLQQKNLYVQALQAYIQAKYNTILNKKIYDFYTGVPVTL